MPSRFRFDSNIMSSIAGGYSAIDIPKLNIKNLQEAESFILNYGFDLRVGEQHEKLWYYHRRALVLMTERLGISIEEIPEELRDRKSLQDLRKLLTLASDSSAPHLQKWSCAFLRCMHVYVHSENDLFTSFAEEIQSQILTPFQSSIIHDGQTTYLKGSLQKTDPVELLGFEIKPFKTSSSTVIKLLAKPDALAMKVFDKLGVRFVTKHLFDSFQVIRLMVEENLISFPHIMPDQSSNNLYPVDLFLRICEELKERKKLPSSEELNLLFEVRLQQEGDTAKFFRKENRESATDFQFIKFITRKLIRVQIPGREPFSFFYPFEVQIMDYHAHQKVKSGPTDHEAYKNRQMMAARERLLMNTGLEL